MLLQEVAVIRKSLCFLSMSNFLVCNFFLTHLTSSPLPPTVYYCDYTVAEVLIPREELLKIRQGVFFSWEVSRMCFWSPGRRSRIIQLLRIFLWCSWEVVYLQVTTSIRTILHALNEALWKTEHLCQFCSTEFRYRKRIQVWSWTSARSSTGLDQKKKYLPKANSSFPLK